jgi:hypothetical protein
MATKRHKPEEIVSKLRQVDVLVGQGQARKSAIPNEAPSARPRKETDDQDSGCAGSAATARATTSIVERI